MANPDLKDDDPWSPPALDLDELYEMFVWVEAYGSDAMLDVYNKLLSAAAETRTAVAHLAEMRQFEPLGPMDENLRQERSEALGWVKTAKPKLLALCEEALALIRSEFRSTRRPMDS